MNRKSFLSMFFAVIAMVIAGAIGNTRTAAAQQNLNVCHYTVDIAGITPCCFPINLQTEWNCLGAIRIDNKIYNANGIYIEPLNPVNPPPAPPCPPACLFNWASLNGPINPTPLNATTQYCFRGCCWLLRTGVDAAGGIVITIRPCP